MYNGKKEFSREQLVFVVEAMLCAALDAVENALPGNFQKGEKSPKHRPDTDFQLGMGLAILYAQLCNEGLGVGDALEVADNFDTKLDILFDESWKNADAIRANFKIGQRQTLAELYGKLWPDCHGIAEKFVDKLFQDYLS